MAFDFPSSPAEGQIFNAPGGPSYVFNTPVWKAVGQGQIAIISDTPPTSPANGALWYESDTGVLYIWYNDGNSSQWVQVGGIQAGAPPPPAADNAEYVMVNGVWRLSRQVFDMAGLATKDIPVPSWGPSKARIEGKYYVPAAPDNAMYLRISTDGTTFPLGSGDYSFSGFYHYAGSQGFANQGIATSSSWPLTSAHNNPDIAISVDAHVGLLRSASGYANAEWHGVAYYSPATHTMSDVFLRGFAGGASFPGNGPVKALRVFTGTAPVSAMLTVEWLP